jgi:hypothetical protein
MLGAVGYRANVARRHLTTGQMAMAVAKLKASFGRGYLWAVPTSGCLASGDTTRQAKRNRVRVTERGEEAWSEAVSRGIRIAFEAAPVRASRHETAKLLWPRATRRKCGGCAVKDRVLTRGDLALCLKGRRC